MFNKFYNKAFYKYIVPVLMLCFSVFLIEPLKANAEDEVSVFITQPIDASVKCGELATFTVECSGEGFTYQWQYNNGIDSNWLDTTVQGSKTNTIQVEASIDNHGYKFRCVANDGTSRYFSDAAVLSVSNYYQSLGYGMTYSFTSSFSKKNLGTGTSFFDIEYYGDVKPLFYFVRTKTSGDPLHNEITFLIEKPALYSITFKGQEIYDSGTSSTLTPVNYWHGNVGSGGSYYANGSCSFSYNGKNYDLVNICHQSNQRSTYMETPHFGYGAFYSQIDSSWYYTDAIALAKEIIDGRMPDDGEFLGDEYWGSSDSGSDDEQYGPGIELIGHDFSKDVIDSDIPIPQLSNISHEGFTLANRQGYYAELIVHNELLGVKFEKQHIGMGISDTWGFVPDKNWVFANKYYNIVDTSEVVIDSDLVNVKETYGYDLVEDLISCFKGWSTLYPKANTLPSYDWLKMGYNTQYVAKHVYSEESEISAAEQLKKSGQARTNYYVRYVDADGHTGQWVKYSFTDAYGTINNGLVYEGSFSVGVVEPDVNGNPVVKDEISGSVNYDNNGELNFTPPQSSQTPTIPEGEIDTTIEDFNDVLEHFSSSITNVSNFVSSMFSFLPSWSLSLLGLALGAVVMLRFLGR